jgi:putative acetyltransferase
VSESELRLERPGDEAAIAALTQAAFRDAEHSDGSEAAIVARLRLDGDLALSLVAEDSGGRIVGHAAFSPVTVSDGSTGWYGLGPVSVLPARQREGIGSALIREGLARLRPLGARGCVVLGDPVYYARFGFAHDPALAYPGPPPRYFQRIVVSGPASMGEVRYARAFG